ncbi:MAG: hypothetical protein K9M11_04415 [Candidatus Pacebacteria bacterium]|nr:hypothetical protein [Candidatus Paceibacterota bacterium]
MESLAEKLASAGKGSLLVDKTGKNILAEVTSSKDADEVILVAKSKEFFSRVREWLKSENFGCSECPQGSALVSYLFLCAAPYRVRLVWSSTALPETAPSSQS